MEIRDGSDYDFDSDPDLPRPSGAQGGGAGTSAEASLQPPPAPAGPPIPALAELPDPGEVSEPVPITAMTATAITKRAEEDRLRQERVLLEAKRRADEEKMQARAMAAQQKAREKVVVRDTALISKDVAKSEAERKKKEDAKKLKAILRKIELYTERFPQVKHMIPKLRASASVEEAQEVLDTIHEEMMSQGSVKSIAQMMNNAFTLVEMFWGNGQMYPAIPEQMRLNLTGISKIFRENRVPQLDPLLMEIDIEYPWLGRRSLFSRLTFTLIEVFLTVHAVNTDPSFAAAFYGHTGAAPAVTQAQMAGAPVDVGDDAFLLS